jgi:Predicted hydrolases or acyltransferases (alpha/beta hydrolase superfamily)
VHRREFLHHGVMATGIGAAVTGCHTALRRMRKPAHQVPAAEGSRAIDAAAFHAMRRFADTRFGRIAYIERGAGAAALFIHGFPLNGFQWRGALERLSAHRRCIAPDLLGLGYTEVANGQSLAPAAQADMLVALLDALAVDAADVTANDSGVAIAQLLAVRYPSRVRSLLLTNGDVHTNSPPAALGPVLAQARDGVLADQFLAPQLADPAFARSPQGLGGLAYTDPASLTDESIGCYFAPLLSSPRRKTLFHGYAVAFEPNPLVDLESALRRCSVPARMVWGTGDPLFPAHWADWLARTLPAARGVRRVRGANLFFPEEQPDLIAEEAQRLWSAG